jgi:hypothetical protein
MATNRKIPLHLGIVIFLLPFLAFSAPKPSETNPSVNTARVPQSAAPAGHAAILDTARIRKLYLNGDFEEAIALLEKGLAEKRPFNHEDSVFIFKHLGVMNAAKYETREIGKKYMYQLLMTEPTAKIMDMYASDMIYMIFKNIQDEFETQRARYGHAKEWGAGNQQTEPLPKTQAKDDTTGPKSPRGHHALLWAGVAGAVAASGVAAYLILSPGRTKTEQRSHSVDGF